MKDSISLETINTVRDKLIAKAGSNPLQLVTITDKNGHITRRWKNMLTDQEIPEEHWTPEMKEAAKRETEQLLSNGPKASEEQKQKIRSKATEKKPTLGKEKRKELREEKKAGKEMSDEDLLSSYYSDDPRKQERAKQAMVDRLTPYLRTAAFKQASGIDKDVVNDAKQDVMSDLFGGHLNTQGKNTEEHTQSLVDKFKTARDKAIAEGGDVPSFDKYMSSAILNKFKNAVKKYQADNAGVDREKNGGDDESEDNYSSDQVYGRSSDLDAQQSAESDEVKGQKRLWVAEALKQLPQAFRIVYVESKLRGMSDDYIGRKYGLDKMAVKKIIERATEKMSDAMDVFYEDENGNKVKRKRPSMLKALQEMQFSLQKSMFLSTLEK